MSFLIKPFSRNKKMVLFVFVLIALFPLFKFLTLKARAFSITTDRSFYGIGETTLYSISNAPANSSIFWTSWKNGQSTGEIDTDYGHKTDASGSWATYGGTWIDSLVGSWVKQAKIGSETGSVGFRVSSIPLVPPPPSNCWQANGFSTSCFSTNNSFPTVSIVDPVAYSLISFSLKIAMPPSAQINAIWNKSYYWSNQQNTWIPVIISGTSYPGTTCINPSGGCWLTNTASASFSIPASAARNNTFYVITWDYTYQNNGWSGPACANASGCWRLTSFPRKEAVNDILNASEITESIRVAQQEGFLVKTKLSNDAKTTIIQNPITYETILAYAEIKQVSTIGNASNDLAECPVANFPDVNLLSWKDNKMYGVNSDFAFTLSCNSASTEVCNKTGAAAGKAVASYNAVSGIPHSGGDPNKNIIRVSWTDFTDVPDFKDTNVIGMALIKYKNNFKNQQHVCDIKLNLNAEYDNLKFSELPEGSMSYVIQHEMGHCFNLAHTERPFMYPYPYSDLLTAQPLPITYDTVAVLQNIKKGGPIQLAGQKCAAACGDFQNFNIAIGQCVCLRSDQTVSDETGTCKCINEQQAVHPTTGLCVSKPLAQSVPIGIPAESLCITGTVLDMSCYPPDFTNDTQAFCQAIVCGQGLTQWTCEHLGNQCWDCKQAGKYGSCGIHFSGPQTGF